MFQKSIALVTGGGSGIGKALCEALAARGAFVLVTDVAGERARSVAAGIRATGGSADAAVLDVTDAAAFESVVERLVAGQGRIDYLFNNAGIAIIGEANDFALEDWRKIFEVNVLGVCNGIHAVYPLMIRQGGGHIVNTASIAGLIPAPGFTAYAGTKHAVVGISTSLRYEAEAHGVKVSAVCPGLVETPIFTEARFLDLEAREETISQARKFAVTPAQCAKAVLAGIAKNEAIVIVSRHAKAAYVLSRFAKPLFNWIERDAVKRLRKAKGGEAAVKQ